MDRQEAVAALELLRKVVGQARDDTTLQNWGVIWIVHGVTNGAGFAATNWLLWRDAPIRPAPFALLWSIVLLFNISCVFGLRDRSAGARTFVETQIWAIWSTFIAAAALTASLNYLMGLSVLFTGPVLAILAAVAFASMGSVIGRGFLWFALLFAATAVTMACLPRWQFFIFAAVWGMAQIGAGLQFHRDKLRRLRTATASPRLV